MEAARESEVRQVAEEFSSRPQGYVLGIGDVMQITVWDHPALTIPAGSFRDTETSGQQIGDDGYLYYPYVGKVKAAGMNIAALRDVLTVSLSTYIHDPQLDISQRYRPELKEEVLRLHYDDVPTEKSSAASSFCP